MVIVLRECKICGESFEAYKIQGKRLMADAYICKDCLLEQIQEWFEKITRLEQ